MPTKTKVIVLDMDNCILLDDTTGKGSEELKDEAWFEIYPEYERAALEPALEEAKKIAAGGKGDRKDIVRWLCRHFGVPEDKIPAEIILRCDNFNNVVQNGIKNLEISERTRKSLALLSLRAPLYVNTATPRENAQESLEALGLSTFFKEILGRPGTKIGNLRDIISRENIDPNELLFVDDQYGGYLAAEEAGCRFVGIHTAKNKAWHNTPQPFPIIRLLEELNKFL